MQQVDEKISSESKFGSAADFSVFRVRDDISSSGLLGHACVFVDAVQRGLEQMALAEAKPDGCDWPDGILWSLSYVLEAAKAMMFVAQKRTDEQVEKPPES